MIFHSYQQNCFIDTSNIQQWIYAEIGSEVEMVVRLLILQVW